MNKWLYLVFLLTISCTKEDFESDCKRFEEAIIADDISRVKSSFSNFISDLADKTHTSENLMSLAEKVSSTCSAKVEVVCYRCIRTLPAQSELKLSFSSSGTTIMKVVDISEESSKEMRFVSMHD